jgi:hypothetical protein
MKQLFPVAEAMRQAQGRHDLPASAKQIGYYQVPVWICEVLRPRQLRAALHKKKAGNLRATQFSR